MKGSGEPMVAARRRFWRVLGVNLLLSFVGVAVVALAGELWLRRSLPFAANRLPSRFVPGVGVLWEPHEEMWYTNLDEFWTISRANRLGFLDREPISPQRAASSCHLALVGDSFVEAREVGVPDKSQVRLEALAARERPDWDITTSAFGQGGIGQIQQIPFYDAYLRRTRPKIVVLVTFRNDIAESSAALRAVLHRSGPECASFAFAVRREDGGFALRLPESPCGAGGWRRGSVETWLERRGRLGRVLQLAADRARHRAPGRLDARRRRAWRRLGSGFPALSGWRQPAEFLRASATLAIDDARAYGTGMAPVIREAFETTSFALAEFQKRGRRDGFELLVLMADHDDPPATRAMPELAERHGIPVISLRDWIDGRGERVGDARFLRDPHWSPRGHRWVAEALWEYLKERPSLCGRAPAG